jgi:hypothetical protein
MTEYVCARHGEIETAVIDMHKLLMAAQIADGSPSCMPKALPMRKQVCARCLAALIDDHFAPLRVKG